MWVAVCPWVKIRCAYSQWSIAKHTTHWKWYAVTLMILDTVVVSLFDYSAVNKTSYKKNKSYKYSIGCQPPDQKATSWIVIWALIPWQWELKWNAFKQCYAIWKRGPMTLILTGQRAQVAGGRALRECHPYLACTQYTALATNSARAMLIVCWHAWFMKRSVDESP